MNDRKFRNTKDLLFDFFIVKKRDQTQKSIGTKDRFQTSYHGNRCKKQGRQGDPDGLV